MSRPRYTPEQLVEAFWRKVKKTDSCWEWTGGKTAAGYGALFGFLVYGVYDFTNFSTLRQWPFVLTLVDTAWGTLAGALCAAAVWAIRR